VTPSFILSGMVAVALAAATNHAACDLAGSAGVDPVGRAFAVVLGGFGGLLVVGGLIA